MSQPRKHSIAEALANTASGFVVSLIAGEFIFPAVGMPITHTQNLLVVSFYTVISVIRSYCWRRAFNWWQHGRSQQMSRELTFGEKAVGLTFNPSNNPQVDAVKRIYADVIDEMENFRKDPNTTSEQKRLASVAITQAQGAQMWAVKALTWKD